MTKKPEAESAADTKGGGDTDQQNEAKASGLMSLGVFFTRKKVDEVFVANLNLDTPRDGPATIDGDNAAGTEAATGTGQLEFVEMAEELEEARMKGAIEGSYTRVPPASAEKGESRSIQDLRLAMANSSIRQAQFASRLKAVSRNFTDLKLRDLFSEFPSKKSVT